MCDDVILLTYKPKCLIFVGFDFLESQEVKCVLMLHFVGIFSNQSI